jgi:hypothetical protein
MTASVLAHQTLYSGIAVACKTRRSLGVGVATGIAAAGVTVLIWAPT